VLIFIGLPREGRSAKASTSVAAEEWSCAL